jgi:ribosomal protein L37AE/L43A
MASDAIQCCKCGHEWTVPHDSNIWAAACYKCNAGTGYRIGIGEYNCDCGNTFVSVARLDVKAPCYNKKCMLVGRMVPTYSLRSVDRDIQKKTNKAHNCDRCRGRGNCPLLQQLNRKPRR